MMINAASAEALTAALLAAKGGEIIDCGGAPLGALSISRRKFPEPVTIRNFACGSGYIGQCENLILEDFIMDFVPTAETTINTPALKITNSTGIKLRKSRLVGRPSEFGLPPETPVGTNNPGGNILGLPSGKGIDISFSSFIDVEENDISNFYKGVTFTGTDDLNIVDNEIHHLRSSPLTGGAINRAAFRGNHAHTSTPYAFGGAGDHGDYLHIFQRNVGKTMFDIVIADNFFSQGDSTTSLLGIYLDDNGFSDPVAHPELYGPDGQPLNGVGFGFERVLIDNNTLFMGHGSGLLIDATTGRVSRNSLIWSRRGRRLLDERDAPRIHATTRAGGVLVVTQNVSSALALKYPETIQVADNYDARAEGYPELYVDALAYNPTLADLQPLPGGALDRLGIGARSTLLTEPTPAPAPEPVPEPAGGVEPAQDAPTESVPAPEPSPLPNPAPAPLPTETQETALRLAEAIRADFNIAENACIRGLKKMDKLVALIRAPS